VLAPTTSLVVKHPDCEREGKTKGQKILYWGAKVKHREAMGRTGWEYCCYPPYQNLRHNICL
jgi:hypothetical protein